MNTEAQYIFQAHGLFEPIIMQSNKFESQLADLRQILGLVDQAWQATTQKSSLYNIADYESPYHYRHSFYSIVENIVHTLNAFALLQTEELPKLKHSIIRQISADEIRSTITADTADEQPFPGQTKE